MVGSFETYRGFVYLTSSGDAKNYGGKRCRYRGGQKRETLIYQRKSQFRFYVLKGGVGGEGRGL